MCAAKSSRWGVITGDVIRSRALGTADHRRMTKAIVGIHDVMVKAGYTITSHAIIRGDSFQLVMPDPTTLLRAALLIRANIRSLDLEDAPQPDVRIGIGVGPIEFKGKSQHESDGTAFRNAAAALEQAKKQNLANIWMISTDPQTDRHVNAINVAWETIIARWTIAQSRTMQGSLQGLVHLDIAKKLKVTQPTVSRALQSADDKVIHYLLAYCQELLAGKK